MDGTTPQFLRLISIWRSARIGAACGRRLRGGTPSMGTFQSGTRCEVREMARIFKRTFGNENNQERNAKCMGVDHLGPDATRVSRRRLITAAAAGA
jgi:hypothetical protein